MKSYIPIVFLLMLAGFTGCTEIGLATTYAENKTTQAIENTRRINDLQARVAIKGPCTIRLGSYHRVLTDLERRAADLLCSRNPVTDDDVQSLREYIELLEISRDAINNGEPE